MRWCRIRLVLLGLLLCVVHVVSGTCGQRFTDPASSALLADVVIEGKVRKTSEPDPAGAYNISVAVRKNIFKGGNLINKGRPAKTVTLDRFTSGAKDNKKCIGSVQKGRTYIFFLRNISDPKGLYFEIMAMPVKKSKRVTSDIKKVSCNNCATAPSIKDLSGQDRVTSGTNTTFKCTVLGNPLPEFSWYKDGVLVKGDKGTLRVNSRKRQSTLTIKTARMKDAGVYECVANNVLGEIRRNISLDVINQRQAEPCETQTLCFNGGTCMHVHTLFITFCQCHGRFEGSRCEKEQPDPVYGNGDVGQANLMLERTLIIVGISIAVLVFIVICIASYILAKKGRKQFQQRRIRREANRTNQNRSAVCVDNRSVPQEAADKRETEIRNEATKLNETTKKSQQIMLQDSSSPPVNQTTHGHITDCPRQLQHSELKINPNEHRPEPRGRLAASSVTNMELPTFTYIGDVRKNKASAVSPTSETIEMRILPETTKEDTKRHQHLYHESLTNGIRPSLPMDQPLQSPEPPSSLSLSPQTNLSGTSPLLLGSSTTPSQTLPPSLNSPSQDHPHRFNDSSFSLSENDTSVQPLLPNHKKHLPMHQSAQSQRPFESKSEKDLSRYLPLSSNRQGIYEPHGQKNDIQDKKHLLRKLTKLSHSNTFPKSKENGWSPDTLSDSDEEDALEVPYEKQLDLYISEDDLDLSKENLVSSSFSSVNTPSRQASHEERGLGLLSKSGISRPGIRKHQSEEGSGYKIVNKSHAYLQDSTRSRSLDNPQVRGDFNPNPQRLNSTLAGSSDVEQYDNMNEHPLQLPNHTYSYDPNDDSSPWEGEINGTGNHSSATVDERDRLNRLKDVVPDQQAIPI